MLAKKLIKSLIIHLTKIINYYIFLLKYLYIKINFNKKII